MFKSYFLSVLLILGQARQIGPAQLNHDKANAKLSGLSLTEISIPEAFAAILSRLGLPGGIVRLLGCEASVNYSFNVNGLNVAEALNYITSYDKKYAWTEQDGVINLLPPGPGPELLSVHVDKLVVTEPNWLAITISGKLLADPKVQERAEELKISGARHPFEFLSNAEEPAIQIELHDVSVREALNRIALKHGGAVWQYSEAHCQQKNEYWVDWVVH